VKQSYSIHLHSYAMKSSWVIRCVNVEIVSNVLVSLCLKSSEAHMKGVHILYSYVKLSSISAQTMSGIVGGVIWLMMSCCSMDCVWKNHSVI
jgi:hypothetical protein